MKTLMTVVTAAVLGLGLTACGTQDTGSPAEVKVVHSEPSPSPHVGASCTQGNSTRCDDAATAHARGEARRPGPTRPHPAPPGPSAATCSRPLSCPE